MNEFMIIFLLFNLILINRFHYFQLPLPLLLIIFQVVNAAIFIKYKKKI